MTDMLVRRYRIVPEATDSRVADETVILHLGNDTYYGLDPVGTVIWEGLKQGHGLTRIRDDILAGFDATQAQVEADMKRFLAHLISEGILVEA